MTTGDWLAVLSSLLSPLVALRVSEWLGRRRGSRDRKEQIFRTLMSTRGEQLSPLHVEALNMIDVEFYGSDKKTTEVIRAWTAYHTHLNQPTGVTPADIWLHSRIELFTDLLVQMAKYLDYDFDRTRIKNSAYSPMAFGEAQADQLAIRKGLAAVFRGQQGLPVALTINAPPPSPPTLLLEKGEDKKGSSA